MNQPELKDIKPIVDINDCSLMLLIALIAGVLLLFAIVGWIYYKKWQKKQRQYKKSLQFKAKETLQNIDFTDTKNAVYTFSKYTQILAKPEQKSTLEQLLKNLEVYKFKKSVKPLEDSHKHAMQSFIKEVI